MTLPNPPSVPSNHILKTDRLDRVHTPPDERERLLAAFEQSSMTMKAFAEHHGIKYQTFTYWCAQRRKGSVQILSHFCFQSVVRIGVGFWCSLSEGRVRSGGENGFSHTRRSLRAAPTGGLLGSMRSLRRVPGEVLEGGPCRGSVGNPTLCLTCDVIERPRA